MPRRPSIAVMLFGLALGCAKVDDGAAPASPADAGRAPAPASPGPDDAEQTLAALEQRLQDAARVELAFDIQSEGAVDSHLAGTSTWVGREQLQLDASGEFAGAAQDLQLRASAESVEVLSGGEVRHTGSRPAALREAVALSFVRQGLLHNLAMLTAGQPPEHGDGGIGEWLVYVDPELGPAEDHAGVRARPVTFGIEVAGRSVGQATLWLGEDGLPIEREQTVDFPEGQMRVVERYPRFSVQ